MKAQIRDRLMDALTNLKAALTAVLDEIDLDNPAIDYSDLAEEVDYDCLAECLDYGQIEVDPVDPEEVIEGICQKLKSAL